MVMFVNYVHIILIFFSVLFKESRSGHVAWTNP